MIGAGYFSYQAYGNYQETLKKKQAELQKRKNAWLALKKYLGRESARFDGSAGIVLKDLDTGWEYTKNPTMLFPSASLVKVPIMAACFQAVQDKKISLEQNVVLRGRDQVLGSGVLKASPPGGSYSVEKLIELMVCRSDNTAANMLINLLGRDYLNSYFKRTGLKSTNLSRKMMDFSRRKKGVENYTTPRDVAFLIEKMYKGKFISPQVSDKCIGFLKMQKVKDRIPKRLPENVVVAHKTGLERSVCHDAGIVFTPEGDFLICVLTKSKSSFKTCKEFIAKISAYTYHNYKMRSL